MMNGIRQPASRRIVSFILFFFALLPIPAQAISISTADGNGADAFVSSLVGQTGTNFGTGPTLFLKNDAGTGFVNRKTYLRFDLSGAGSIGSASLSLTYEVDTAITAPGPDAPGLRSFRVFGLVDGHAGESWVESGITWNNAPANNTGSGSGLLAGQFVSLGSFSFDSSVVPFGSNISFTSDALASFLQADSDDLVTLIIVRQDKSFNNVGFASKENLELAGPILNITAVPEPSTWLLMLVSLGMLLRFRYSRL